MVQIINDGFINNKDYYNNYFNVFPQNNSEEKKQYFLNDYNIEDQQLNIICENNNQDNNINGNVNILNNFLNISNRNNINCIKNINYINNLNFINNMLTLDDNMSNIINISNNDLYNISINKYSKMSLLEISNKLDIIAKKQPGCRFLENLIKTNENSYAIINKIFFHNLN